MSEEKKENSAIEFLGNIQASFTGMKTFMYICAVVCVVIAIGTSVGSVYIAQSKIDEMAKNIYVLDQGYVLMANRTDNNAQKDLEVMDHVTRFHELFYNLAPNITTITQNVERALELADESAYNYYCDLKESKYYSRLIDINATQQISVDSVNVDIFRYPYTAEVKASIYVMRESNISLYDLTTTCEITETERTPKNPHGLMITNFYATKPRFIGTKTRTNRNN